MKTGSIGASLAALNTTLMSSPDADSVHNYLEQIGGEEVTGIITLTGTGSTSVNIFQLTGTVEVLALHGGIATAGTLTNMTGVHFELWDSTAAIDLTKNDGVLSGMAVGTFFAKNAAVGVTMAVLDNVIGAFTEGGVNNKAFTSFLITKKSGANTYIRLTYTTTDDPIVGTLKIQVRYIPHNDGVSEGALVAV